MTAITSKNPTMTAAGSTTPAGPAIIEASPTQVHAWLRAGEAVIIDVREPDEHAREHIAGATLIPLSRFDVQKAAALAKPGERIVIHCRSGRRSSDACRLAAGLVDRGITIVNMTGGIEAWKRDALPVTMDMSVTGISVMRQVQLVIGVCVLVGSALAWFVSPVFIVVPAFFGAGLTVAGATGTCALATLIGKLPWNRTRDDGASCSTGKCG